MFALCLLLIVLLTALPLRKRLLVTECTSRTTQLDGLRGLLAVSVFIHHASIWYTYLHTHTWSNPESHLFNQLGQTGVSMFFMISSFLFVRKMLEFEGERFDWKSFYIQRIFRLAPLHFLLIGVILLIVFIQSDWQLRTSFYELSSSLTKWLGFGTIGFAELNGMDAAPVNSGVLWSLSYEWLLYLSLPFLALLLNRSKPAFPYLVFATLFIACTLFYRSYEIQHLLSFLGGAIAPFILKYKRWKSNFNHPLLTMLLLGSLGSILLFHSPENLFCKALIAFAFSLIALGNTVFGALNSHILRFLGEISYGIYLMHGILIFVVIHYVVGAKTVLTFSPLQYCLLLMGTAPFVILFSFLAYRWLELPMMVWGKKLSGRKAQGES